MSRDVNFNFNSHNVSRLLFFFNHHHCNVANVLQAFSLCLDMVSAVHIFMMNVGITLVAALQVHC
jgi:hypothetical protein